MPKTKVKKEVEKEKKETSASKTVQVYTTLRTYIRRFYSNLFTYRIAIKGRTGIGFQCTVGSPIPIATLTKNGDNYKKVMVGTVAKVMPNVDTGETTLILNLDQEVVNMFKKEGHITKKGQKLHLK